MYDYSRIKEIAEKGKELCERLPDFKIIREKRKIKRINSYSPGMCLKMQLGNNLEDNDYRYHDLIGRYT